MLRYYKYLIFPLSVENFYDFSQLAVSKKNKALKMKVKILSKTLQLLPITYCLLLNRTAKPPILKQTKSHFNLPSSRPDPH